MADPITHYRLVMVILDGKTVTTDVGTDPSAAGIYLDRYPERKLEEIMSQDVEIKPDWRIGLRLKPKYAIRLRSNGDAQEVELGETVEVMSVHPGGFGGINTKRYGITNEPHDVLRVRTDSGRYFLTDSDAWVTA